MPARIPLRVYRGYILNLYKTKGSVGLVDHIDLLEPIEPWNDQILRILDNVNHDR